jgi:SAM-dependent methyltransferase
LEWVAGACSCGGAAATPIFQLRGGGAGEGARMMRCRDCGGLFPDRLPADPRAAYASYYTLAPVRGGWRALARRAVDLTRRDYQDRGTPAAAARVLDYGCGGGGFLARLSRSRPACRRSGTDALGPPAGADFEWLDPEGFEQAGPFDWITLGHVVEHLDDPAAILAGLAARLSSDGGLWIATPNADSFLFATAGRWARDADFPRHRQIFSRRGLAKRLAEAGLTPQFHSPPRINAVLNTLQTVENIVVDGSRGWTARGRAAGGAILALIGHLVQPAATRDPSSPEIVVVCRAARPA